MDNQNLLLFGIASFSLIISSIIVVVIIIYSSNSEKQQEQKPTSIEQTVPPCDVEKCNSFMQDWIVNKYWAFEDTAKNHGECSNCPSRWFKAPMDGSKDGQAWERYDNRNDAYNALKL